VFRKPIKRESPLKNKMLKKNKLPVQTKSFTDK